MKHPFRILPVFGMKTAVSGDVRVEHFYGSHAVELQLPIPLTPSGLGKAQRLPAHQHNLLPGGAADTIRMNHAHHGLAFQRHPTNESLLRSPPSQLSDFFHLNTNIPQTKLFREGKCYRATKPQRG